jgi:4-hydroxythreonine-4-phosphate dehydrogenase
MKNWLGIALGDVTGIGPEVALKALVAEANRDEFKYLLLGDEKIIGRLNETLALNLPLKNLAAPPLRPDEPGKFFVTNPLGKNLTEPLRAGSAAAARAALAFLRDGAERCLRGELAGLVTAPVNKQALVRAGFKNFVGQTEFLSALAGTRRTAMMLLGQDEKNRWLRVALATIHVSLKSVPRKLTPEKIARAVELAAQACRDLQLPRAKIAVCGLNPHAGEGGEFGDEEIKIIAPTIRALRKKGLDVAGPLSGDMVFYHALRGDFDAVVAMYHDQGLAPLKAVAFDTGVNWTLGLPFIRTSPDHGTAYDIAGKGIANPSSMIAALRLAKQLAGNRPAA